MKSVETYVTVHPDDISKALTDKNFLPFQGSNILFIYTDYKDVDVFSFLRSIFTIVGKIAVESKKGNYSIISDKYNDDVIEPFNHYEDISKKMENDIEKISNFITSSFVNKYDL